MPARSAAKGGVDPAAFNASMYDAEGIDCSSESEMVSEFSAIKSLLLDSKADWEKRVQVCKRLRGLIEGGLIEQPGAMDHLKDAAEAFAAGAKDLRSAVSKETCITLSRISDATGVHFETIAKTVLPVLLKQVAINVRVLADSADLCTQHILRTCHCHRLVSALAEAAANKAVSIRRCVYGYVELVLQSWPSSELKRQIASFTTILTKGQSDADAEVRKLARAGYWAFEPNFPTQAATLMKKLDPSKKKQLLKDQGASSGAAGGGGGGFASSATSGTVGPPRASAGPRRSAISKAKAKAKAEAKAAAEAEAAAAAAAEADAKSSARDVKVSAPSRTKYGINSKRYRTTSGGKAFSLDWDGDGNDAQGSGSSKAGSGSSANSGNGPKRVAASSSSSSSSSNAGVGVLSGSSRSTGSAPPSGKTIRGGVRNGAGSDRLSKSGTISAPSRVSRPSSGSGGGSSSTGTASRSLNSASTSEQQRNDRASSSVGPPSRTSSRPSSSSSSSSYAGAKSEGGSGGGGGGGASAATSLAAAAARSASTPAPRTFSEDLVDVLRLSKSASWADRLEAVNLLKAQIRGTSAPTDRDVQKVMSYYMKQFSEAHKKVFSGVIDTMCDFVVIFKEEISDAWFRDCMVALILKLGAELATPTQSKVLQCLELIRTSFSGRVQLLTVFRMMRDYQGVAQNTKVKVAQMDYLALLLPKLDVSVLEGVGGTTDTVAAVERIVAFCNEPRSPELRRVAMHVLLDLFEIEPAAFGDTVNAMSAVAAEHCGSVLDGQLGANWRGRAGVAASPDPAPSPQADTLPPMRSKPSSSSGGGAASANLEKRTSAYGFDQLAAEGSDGETLEAPPDVGYDPAVYAEHVSGTASGAAAGSVPASSANGSRSSSSSGGGKHPPIGSNLSRDFASAVERRTSPPPFSMPQAMSEPDLPALPVSNDAQVILSLEAMQRELGSGSVERGQTKAALENFAVISKDGDMRLWSDHFGSVLPAVLSMLSDDDATARDLSLRVVRSMLKHQTLLIEESVEEVVTRLLERHSESDRHVLRSVEETLSVLSNVITPTTCARILEPIILGDDGSVLLAAIAMLTKVLQKMSQDEMISIQDNCIPGIIKAYKHPMAEVRKGVVFALVEMYLTIGAPLMEHLGDLSSSQNKLLAIYIKRAEERISQQMVD